MNGFDSTFVHTVQAFVTLAMVIGADIITLVVGLLHRAYRPRTADDGVRFEQFHRTVGVHLRRDDGAEVFLEVDGVDSRLCAVCIIANLKRAGELLVFQSVPMKTNTDADILQNECLFPLLEFDLRSS